VRNLLARRDDFLFPIESHFNKIFDQMLGTNSLKDSLKASQGYPKMDVVEDEKFLTVKVAVPGLKTEDVVVEYNSVSGQPEVTISGKMSQSYESPENAKYYVKELRQSVFKRTLLLPEYATKEPDAVLEDGILTLKWEVPLAAKDPEPKRVAIRGTNKALENKKKDWDDEQ
jgi:HSP20 family molecular chaperone IbpA